MLIESIEREIRMKLSTRLFGIGCIVTLTNFVLVTHSFAVPANTQSVVISSDERNILADIAVIDKTEILLAVVAANKKPSSDVMDFAKFMIEQHGSNLTQILEMAHNLHFNSLSDKESNQLTAQGNEALIELGSLQGKQFDKAYIDAMVKGHQAALDLIDNQLTKEAKTESIKSFLSDTRAAVVHHLDMAKKIQASL